MADCDQTIALCEEHYRRMYLYLNRVRPCDSCGEKPQRNEMFNRHCLSLNRQLEKISSELSNLSASSIVCILSISRQANSQSTTSEQSPSLNALGTIKSTSKAQNISKEKYIK